MLELLRRIPPGPHDGLPRAEALAALLAARTAAGLLDAARQSTPEAVAALRNCGLLFHRADVLAWLAAACGKHQVAAQVLGSVDEFHVRNDGPRDRLAARAREESLRLISRALAAGEQQRWIAQGRRIDEGQLVALLMTALSAQQCD
jgi:DNA topoisomerase IB